MAVQSYIFRGTCPDLKWGLPQEFQLGKTTLLVRVRVIIILKGRFLGQKWLQFA